MTTPAPEQAYEALRASWLANRIGSLSLEWEKLSAEEQAEWEELLYPSNPHYTEWAVFWGGDDPDDCAGADVYADEADADENRQWIIGGGLATRPVWRGPWTVVRPPAAALAPGEDPDDNLTDELRAQYLEWRKEQGLS